MQLVNGQAESDPVPSRDTSSLAQYSIPKFDLDEFMRQYFRQSILMNIGNDFIHNNVNEPFDPVQLFRASIAARDCMAKAVSQKLKVGHLNNFKFKKPEKNQLQNSSYYVSSVRLPRPEDQVR